MLLFLNVSKKTEGEREKNSKNEAKKMLNYQKMIGRKSKRNFLSIKENCD
jgi:hypothetical protein